MKWLAIAVMVGAAALLLASGGFAWVEDFESYGPSVYLTSPWENVVGQWAEFENYSGPNLVSMGTSSGNINAWGSAFRPADMPAGGAIGLIADIYIPVVNPSINSSKWAGAIVQLAAGKGTLSDGTPAGYDDVEMVAMGYNWLEANGYAGQAELSFWCNNYNGGVWQARTGTGWLACMIDRGKWYTVKIDVIPLTTPNVNGGMYNVKGTFKERTASTWTNLGTWYPYSEFSPAYIGISGQGRDYTFPSGQIDNVAYGVAGLSGRVTLNDYLGDKSLVSIRVELTPVIGGAAKTATVPLDSSGNYAISGVVPGTYDIAFTACESPTKTVNNVMVMEIGGTCDITLANGDVNGDGGATSADTNILLKNIDAKGE